eukprot:6188342-Pleurochrysis_carterae.AAC.1
MAAITDLRESNQLATTILGSHSEVFMVSPIVLEKRSLSPEERQFLNSIEHRIAPYAEDLPAMSQHRNLDKAYRSILSLEAKHRYFCLELQQEPLSRPQDVLALLIASFLNLPTPNRFELLAVWIHPDPRCSPGLHSRAAVSAQRYSHPSRRRHCMSRPRRSNVGKGVDPRP